MKLPTHGLMLSFDALSGVGGFQLASKDRASFYSLCQSIPRGAIWRMEFSRHYPKRSTGPKSQNHRINGFIQQICEQTHNSFSAVKERMKELAVDRGYPFETLPDGSIQPKSEADINTQEASWLIDTIEQFAAEWGIKLREE